LVVGGVGGGCCVGGVGEGGGCGGFWLCCWCWGVWVCWCGCVFVVFGCGCGLGHWFGGGVLGFVGFGGCVLGLGRVCFGVVVGPSPPSRKKKRQKDRSPGIKKSNKKTGCKPDEGEVAGRSESGGTIFCLRQKARETKGLRENLNKGGGGKEKGTHDPAGGCLNYQEKYIPREKEG